MFLVTQETAELKWRKHLKPERALGRLETATFRLAELRGKLQPPISRLRLILFLADHGIASKGVSAMEQSATAHLIDRISAGGAAANIFCRHAGVELETVDVGSRYSGPLPSGIMDCRVAPGTQDISERAAMTPAQRDEAIEHGRAAARRAIQDGVDLLGVGEIGIGNTTVAAALTSLLLDLEPSETVDRGTGITPEQLKLKRQLVRTSLDRHRERARTPVESLACLGGFEFAAIFGVALTCAESKLPLVTDGYATAAATLLAAKTSTAVSPVVFASHVSRERGHRHILTELNLDPFFELDFCLGEGTGSVLGMQFLELGSNLLADLACF